MTVILAILLIIGFFGVIFYVGITIVEIIWILDDYPRNGTAEAKAAASRELRHAPLWPLKALAKFQDAWLGR